MFKAVSALAALLAAVAILLAGNGLQVTLLSVRANIEGFTLPMIGLLMSAYFIGYIGGCRFSPRLIGAVGHIRTFVALASIASASALAHILIIEIEAWVVLRVITGFCLAGLFMIIESWINEQADNDNRGKILSIYRIVDLVALLIGNALLAAGDARGFHLFAIVSILLSLSLVPVALTRSSAPQPLTTAGLDIKKLINLSPVASAGAAMSGLANAALWAVGPVYVQRMGHNEDAVAMFMSLLIIGAAVSQWPLGWLSDRIDRRKVLAIAATASVIASLMMSSYASHSLLVMNLIAVPLGAFMIPILGLAIAHANDHAEPGTAVATNGGLLLLHGCGSAAGALIGAVIMYVTGPESLYLYFGAIYGILAIFCLIRIIGSPAVPKGQKSPFQPIPRNASPTVFEIGEDDV